MDGNPDHPGIDLIESEGKAGSPNPYSRWSRLGASTRARI
jgi:hypothetical protein